MWQFIVGSYPNRFGMAWREDALKSDDWCVGQLTDLFHRAVQFLCKWMGGIDNEPDALLLAEPHHFLAVHGSVHLDAMVQRDVLLPRFGGVVECVARLLKCGNSLPSFCGASENQYHSFSPSPFLKRWVKCLE